MPVALLNRLPRFRPPSSALRRILTRVLRDAGRPRARVNLVFVGPAEMRRLHARHLGEEAVTDVLAFPGPELLLGEVVVCPAVARRAARARGISMREELVRYAVHGLLHLLGHRDDRPPSRRRMWRVQERHVRCLADYR